jgi:hypothetical protein
MTTHIYIHAGKTRDADPTIEKLESAIRELDQIYNKLNPLSKGAAERMVDDAQSLIAKAQGSLNVAIRNIKAER